MSFTRPIGRAGANQAIALRGGGVGGRADRPWARTEVDDNVLTSRGENTVTEYTDDMSGSAQAGQQTEFCGCIGE